MLGRLLVGVFCRETGGGGLWCVSTQGRLDRLRRALVDWGSAGLGFSILGHQAFIVEPGKAQWPLIVTGLTLLGVQTGVALVSQVRNASPPSTDAGSPPPAPPSLPAGPSSPHTPSSAL
jgi:hypothetical protein